MVRRLVYPFPREKKQDLLETRNERSRGRERKGGKKKEGKKEEEEESGHFMI